MDLRILSFLFFAFPLFAQAGSMGSQVEFAYRASSRQATERRIVQVQGARQHNGFRFEEKCGPTGERCECRFFRSSTDKTPVRSREY